MDLDWPPKILERGLHRCDINCAEGSPAAAKIEWRPDLVRVAFSFRRVCFGAGPFSDLRAARVMVLYFSTDLLQQVFFSRDRQVGVLLLCGDGKPGSPAVVGDKV